MQLTTLDYGIVFFFFLAAFGIGFWSMMRAGKSSSEFFLSGRTMPWWLLGISLVATTFAADTPTLITDMVRKDGVAGNWPWWAFLITGMTTVFIYARLWRRLGLMTDIEFYEVRYSGRSATFLRGFRTIYIGLICNIVTMATVTMAIIKILAILVGSDPYTTVIIAGAVTMMFTMLGGFTAVLWADFILFVIAMVGSFAAAWFALQMPEVGGLSGLMSHPDVAPKLSIFPDFSNPELVVTLLVIPLAVQWWSVWYPGAEPGGGSFVAQRMLAAKNETHAIGATLFFNACHYALRPWPWIIVALASLILFPDVASIKTAFPNLPDHMVRDDAAYSAMLTYLPTGWSGLVLASLFAAYMSTIATLLNLSSSYVVNDLYHRFIERDASEKRLVLVGRISTALLMIASCILGLMMTSAKDSFEILLQIGAGTGLLFLIRWFWWRVNAWSEIAAMAIAFPTALYFKFGHVPLMQTVYQVPLEEGAAGIPDWLHFSSPVQIVLGVTITTVGWILVTLLTPPTDEKTLREFVRRSRAGGPGWRRIVDRAKKDGDDLGLDASERWPVPLGVACSVIGCISIYGALFAVGQALYGNYGYAIALAVVSVLSGGMLLLAWKRVTGEPSTT